MQSKKRDERSPTRNQTEHTMKTHDIKNGTAVKGATSIATMKDSSGPPVGQQRMVRPRHEWLTQCGMSTTGMIGSGIGCGKFLPASNWMRRDGMDSRGGAFGNAPLCSECSEK